MGPQPRLTAQQGSCSPAQCVLRGATTITRHPSWRHCPKSPLHSGGTDTTQGPRAAQILGATPRAPCLSPTSASFHGLLPASAAYHFSASLGTKRAAQDVAHRSAGAMFKPTRHRGGASAGHTVMGNVSPWGCTMALTPEQQHGRGWGGPGLLSTEGSGSSPSHLCWRPESQTPLISHLGCPNDCTWCDLFSYFFF